MHSLTVSVGLTFVSEISRWNAGKRVCGKINENPAGAIYCAKIQSRIKGVGNWILQKKERR